MSAVHDIYLIPGFFGFAMIGKISYFHHVRDLLERDFNRAGLQVAIHEVQTLPTSSIRKRAKVLFDTIEKTASPSGPILLIGHSTGGLDARMFATPAANIDADPQKLEEYASRVKAIVTVATPHYGTPIASFFNSMLGAKILYLASLATVYTLQFGKLPLSMLLYVGRIITRADDYIGFRNSVLDQFYDSLFADFDENSQNQLSGFAESIFSDQTLLGQLAPGGIDLFNGSCENRKETRYGSVAMKARKPGFKTIREIGIDPYRQASHILYRVLHAIVSDKKAHFPEPTQEQRGRLVNAYEKLPDGRASDGIVPTRSQVWGDLFYAGHGDHLDVCGHFNDSSQDPPHIDWIATGTSFSRPQFEGLWSSVATYLQASLA